MLIARDTGEAGFDPRSVVTIGTFDGMHLGHRAIIGSVLEKRAVNAGRAVVITFDPHPRSVVGGSPVGLLTTMEERIALLREAGIDLVLIVPFTREFSRQSASEFYEKYILRGTGVSEVVVGHDHMFGRDREASIDNLREMGARYGFAVTSVGPVALAGHRISSSSIRRLLSDGNVAGAAEALGRPYSLRAVVVGGEGRGARLGFPTANLRPLSEEKIVPRRGVYAAEAEARGASRLAMVNVGTRPTFTDSAAVVIEAHLFDWSGDLYGETLEIRFTEYLREEKKFSSAADLAAQLALDREACLGRASAGRQRTQGT
jgi:riboflavin kinase/FMN adenylyltransferase